MLAKYVYVAENCPFEMLKIAPIAAAARMAICFAIEPNFWEPVDPPTAFEFEKCMGCIAERGQEAVSCDYFYTCLELLREAEAQLLIDPNYKAIEGLCCPTPVPPFVPTPNPEDQKHKYKHNKGYGGYTTPQPPMPYY